MTKLKINDDRQTNYFLLHKPHFHTDSSLLSQFRIVPDELGGKLTVILNMRRYVAARFLILHKVPQVTIYFYSDYCYISKYF